MAEKQQKQPSAARNRKLLLAVLGAVVIVGAVILFSLPREGTSPAAVEEGAAEEKVIVPALDLSVLSSDVFSRFKVWSVLPLTVGELGKENPFGR